jgi:hypothetical protein
MRALTPAALTQAGRSLRLLRFAFRASHPHPRRAPGCRFDRHASASGDFQASPYPGRLAVPLRRIGFVSYGLLLRLLLLSTPPRGDAVTLDYARCDFVRQGLSTPLTKRPHGRTRAQTSVCSAVLASLRARGRACQRAGDCRHRLAGITSADGHGWHLR